MKLAFPILLLLFLAGDRNQDIPGPDRVVAKCYGYSPCNACSNCSMCKHCNAGGTCGKCAATKSPRKSGGSSQPAPVKSPENSSQCKAITKKGTRCSRNSSSGGYCWQHKN
jgi:hypothetical protein